eukprot:s4575_g6.t1
MFQTRPWDGEGPALGRIPHDTRGGEASFKLDLFHCWKVGLGRDLTGSTIMYLALAGKFDDPLEPHEPRNVPARLERAHGSFRLWCLANHKTASCRSFTKYNMMAPDLVSFPWFNAKGSDNTLVTRWLLWFLRAMPPDPGQIYLAMQQCLNSATVFFDLLHTHPLWLEPACARRAQHHLSVMLRGYKYCAAESHRKGVFAFGLKPKLHSLHHVNKDLLRQLRRKLPLILNPMIFSCEANEDAVGRLSRLARKAQAIESQPRCGPTTPVPSPSHSRFMEEQAEPSRAGSDESGREPGGMNVVAEPGQLRERRSAHLRAFLQDGWLADQELTAMAQGIVEDATDDGDFNPETLLDLPDMFWELGPGDVLCILEEACCRPYGHLILLLEKPHFVHAKYAAFCAVECTKAYRDSDLDFLGDNFLFSYKVVGHSQDGYALLGWHYNGINKRPEGSLQRAEFYMAPSELRQCFSHLVMCHVLRDMTRQRGKWALSTALRAALCWACPLCPQGLGETPPLPGWQSQPICTSVIICFWQRYLLTLSPQQHVSAFLPRIKADEALPTVLRAELLRCHWVVL